MDDEVRSAHPVGTHSIFVGEGGLRSGWGLLIFFALFAAMLSLANVVNHRLHPGHIPRAREMSARSTFLSESIPLVCVLVAGGVMSRIERRRFSAYGLGAAQSEGDRRWRQFFMGMVWGIFFLSLLILALKTFGLLVFDGRLLFGAEILKRGAIWLGGFLLVALLEETLLRGYVQFTLARGLSAIYEALHVQRSGVFGFWTAALLLSTLFGLGHGSNPGESPIGLLSAGVAGLVFCLSLCRTGSLWWAIGFHSSWDWGQSFLYGVADSGTMVQFHLYATHAVGRPILSGGATGPEGSIFILPIMALIAGVIIWTLPKAAGLHN